MTRILVVDDPNSFARYASTSLPADTKCTLLPTDVPLFVPPHTNSPT